MKKFVCNSLKFLTFGIVCLGWCKIKRTDETTKI